MRYILEQERERERVTTQVYLHVKSFRDVSKFPPVYSGAIKNL